MLEKIKGFLGLNPMAPKDESLGIEVGVFQNKLHIKLSRKVDVITFDKGQLSRLLAAIAGQAAGIK